MFANRELLKYTCVIEVKLAALLSYVKPTHLARLAQNVLAYSYIPEKYHHVSA